MKEAKQAPPHVRPLSPFLQRCMSRCMCAPNLCADWKSISVFFFVVSLACRRPAKSHVGAWRKVGKGHAATANAGRRGSGTNSGCSVKEQQERLEKFLTSRIEPKGLFSSPPVPIENWGQECQKWSGGEEPEKGANFQASIKSSSSPPPRPTRETLHA